MGQAKSEPSPEQQTLLPDMMEKLRARCHQIDPLTAQLMVTQLDAILGPNLDERAICQCLNILHPNVAEKIKERIQAARPKDGSFAAVRLRCQHNTLKTWAEKTHFHLWQAQFQSMHLPVDPTSLLTYITEMYGILQSVAKLD